VFSLYGADVNSVGPRDAPSAWADPLRTFPSKFAVLDSPGQPMVVGRREARHLLTSSFLLRGEAGKQARGGARARHSAPRPPRLSWFAPPFACRTSLMNASTGRKRWSTIFT